MRSVVRRAALDFQPDGPTRGYAHFDIDFDFDPLLFFAEGRMKPGEGFEMHRHEGIENLMLVLDGQVRHRGSDGGEAIVGPDEVSLMSAGAGGEHAEHVHGDAPVRALVIWLRSQAPNAPCRFAAAPAFGENLRPLDLPLRCSATVLTSRIDAGGRVEHTVGHRAYLAAFGGRVAVGDVELEDGDRLLVRAPGHLRIDAVDPARIVVVAVESR